MSMIIKSPEIVKKHGEGGNVPLLCMLRVRVRKTTLA